MRGVVRAGGVVHSARTVSGGGGSRVPAGSSHRRKSLFAAEPSDGRHTGRNASRR